MRYKPCFSCLFHFPFVLWSRKVLSWTEQGKEKGIYMYEKRKCTIFLASSHPCIFLTDFPSLPKVFYFLKLKDFVDKIIKFLESKWLYRKKKKLIIEVLFLSYKTVNFLSRQHINILGDLKHIRYVQRNIVISRTYYPNGGLRQSIYLMLLPEFMFVHRWAYPELVEVVWWTH